MHFFDISQKSLWMDLLPMPDFETSFISHLENVDSIKLYRFSQYKHISFYNVKESHSLTSPLMLERSVRTENLSSWWWRQIFKNYNSLLKLKLYHLSPLLFPLKWQAFLIHSPENVCQIPKCEYPEFVCQFFQVKTVFSEKCS